MWTKLTFSRRYGNNPQWITATRKSWVMGNTLQRNKTPQETVYNNPITSTWWFAHERNRLNCVTLIVHLPQFVRSDSTPKRTSNLHSSGSRARGDPVIGGARTSRYWMKCCSGPSGINARWLDKMGRARVSWGCDFLRATLSAVIDAVGAPPLVYWHRRMKECTSYGFLGRTEPQERDSHEPKSLSWITLFLTRIRYWHGRKV